jgi:Na+-transporting NADH:ubiquinone oxidoreductase subunit NqrA
MASDPKVYFDDAQGVWVCIYVCLGGSTGGHADICIAFSTDLVRWDKEDTPIYVAGGHPSGIDTTHAHKVSLIYDADGVGYLYYTAVGPKGRGIALLTSRNKN